MITKQQKFIEDNDIVGTSSQDKSKCTFLFSYCVLDLDIFLDEANDLIDDQENDEEIPNTNSVQQPENNDLDEPHGSRNYPESAYGSNVNKNGALRQSL